ncbi:MULTISPECIES: Spy/CpxP family protein refolding chaperone [unclassified Pseudoalteromonas]|uniref:Spy/CpxP family protein refolding chaperone n=1 Tax=unclassified Pseudoalteromonas TaxID=194690 RepID=UPI00301485BB
MKLLTTLALASVLSVGMFSTEVSAKPYGGQLEHSARLLLSEKGQQKLDITEEQRTQLRAIFSDYKAAKKALKSETSKEERQAHRDAIKALMESEVFDKVQAQLLLEQGQSKKQQWTLLAMEARHKVFHVLSAEQREKIQSWRMRHRGHKKQHKG